MATQFNHLLGSFSYKEVQVIHISLCSPVKTSCHLISNPDLPRPGGSDHISESYRVRSGFEISCHPTENINEALLHSGPEKFHWHSSQ